MQNVSVRFTMRFIQQATTLPVENIDEKIGKNVGNKSKRHGELLPNSVRCILAGPSSCGKTNVLISLLEQESGLKFENIYIYSKTLHQEKYQYLENIIKPIKEIGYYTFSSNEEVIPPNEAKPNSIFIFDDVISEKQPQICSYFTLGRHYHVDSFYLTQTYSRVGKQLIRDNANLLILFRQDETNLKHIYKDFSVGCDMTFPDFMKMCQRCWSDKFGFVVLDMDSEPNKGRYRCGFDKFIQL